MKIFGKDVEELIKAQEERYKSNPFMLRLLQSARQQQTIVEKKQDKE